MAWVVFRQFFTSMNIQVMSLGVAFILIFGGLMIFLGRIKSVQRNKYIKTLISFCLALFAIYGIARSGLNILNVFYRIGFNQDFIYNFILISLILLFILTGFTKVRTFSGHKKRIWRLHRSLITFGLLFVGIGVTPLVQYAKTVVIGIGVGLVVLGLVVKSFSKKKHSHTKIKLI